MEERWRPVVGYEGLYDVSDYGRVRRALAARGTRVGLILRAASNTDGYLQVTLYRDGRRRSERVHKLVAAAFLGPCPDGHEVNHRQDPKSNNAVANLEYVTHPANTLHKYRVLGRAPVCNYGEQGPSKLTRRDVLEIRRRLRENESHAAIARDFPVTRQTISKIASGQRWPAEAFV